MRLALVVPQADVADRRGRGAARLPVPLDQLLDGADGAGPMRVRAPATPRDRITVTMSVVVEAAEVESTSGHVPRGGDQVLCRRVTLARGVRELRHLLRGLRITRRRLVRRQGDVMRGRGVRERGLRRVEHLRHLRIL